MAEQTEDYWIQYGKFPTGEGPPSIWLLDKYFNARHVGLDIFNATNKSISIPDLGASQYNINDDIDFVILPPYTSIDIFNRGDYTGAVTKSLNQPGFYRMADYGLLNAAGSIKAQASRNWADAMVPCCTGQMEGKWCGAWNPKSSGTTCDARMKDYCSKPENKDKDVCACINSSIKYLPSCFDTKCTNNPLAYKTKDMRDVVSAGCPDIMECSQYITLTDEAKQNVVNRTQMEQNCTSIKNITTPTGTTTSGTTTSNTNPTPTSSTNTGDQPDSGSYGTADSSLGSTSPYVPTTSTGTYSPPSSSPYAGPTQPGAYNNPYNYQPTTTSYPYSTNTNSTATSSNKILGMDPSVLMIIIIVAFVFIAIIGVIVSGRSSPRYQYSSQYSSQYPPQYSPQYSSQYSSQ